MEEAEEDVAPGEDKEAEEVVDVTQRTRAKCSVSTVRSLAT